MATRGDTFHILQGHVTTANTANSLTCSKEANANRYSYDASNKAVNKFISQGNPKLLAQTFRFSNRSTARPPEISPVMMLK